VAPGSSLKHFCLRFAIALAVVLVATGIAVSTGNRFIERAVDDIPTVQIREEVLAPPPPPEEKGAPANFLIIGTDSRAFVQNEQQAQAFGTTEDVAGQRSDTTMVVHVEPDSRVGFVVSFPRDLWVDIPGHGEDRINAALELGGPSLLIETITANFDVPIHHYLEVDIDGFQQIVNTIGGVDIYFPTPARDAFSGLDQPEAGCRELSGAQALEYVRARHYEWYDQESGRWRDDPRSDLSRIERQQYFMRSLAQASLDRGARNPLTAFRLLDDISGALARDPDLELSDIRGLINAFRDLDPSSVEMLTLPIEGTYRGDAQVLVPKEPEADAMLTRLRTFSASALPQGFPAAVAPSEVRVRVLNGTGDQALGAQVHDGLAAHGFDVVGPAEAAPRDDHPLTQIRFVAGAGGKAVTTAAFTGTANTIEARPGEIVRADVVVIVGADWPGLAAPLKEPPDPNTTTVPDPGVTGDTTATTTTTVAESPSATAVVPVDPTTGGPLVGCP
jgi:LCP family protein required for cell wall assembly